jgi:DNA-binding helix-hairpin-helix protein with protein kinase domain
VSSIPYAQIAKPGDLSEIGKGGEGRVFLIRSMPGMVYKEFVDFPGHTPDRTALEELMNLLPQMTPDERTWLAARTTWPQTLVLDGNRMKGFLMPLIGQQYFKKYGIRANPKTVACEWNYLSMREKYASNKNIYSEIPRVTPFEALTAVVDLCKTMAILHKYNMVIGDMSGRNLLWTDSPSLRVMIIDCDSFHPEGKVGVSPPKQSPDWEDPALTTPLTTMQSDIYKLGLAAFRGIWAATTDRPLAGNKPIPSVTDGVPEVVRSLIERSVGNGPRPTAQEWVDSLKQAVAFNGRPAIAIDQSGKISRPTVDRSSEIPRGDRPVIQMRE